MSAISDRERFDGLAAGNGWDAANYGATVVYERGAICVHVGLDAGGALQFAERFAPGVESDTTNMASIVDGWLSAAAPH